VAPQQIQQQDLWYTVPEPSDTALTILSKSVHDTTSEQLESERYDTGLLDTLLAFKQILDGKIQIKLSTAKRRHETFILNGEALEKIHELRKATPEPQAVLVSGCFDIIQHSTRRFQLTMKNGQTVRGKIDEGSIALEEMRRLWGKQVTIKGMLHFMASEKPRFLEAQVINPYQNGDELFETMRLPLSTTETLMQTRKEVSQRNIVSEIWDMWPGEESIEQILSALKQSETSN
jgi:hypothetical protein